jgi:hypothetical protein
MGIRRTLFNLLGGAAIALGLVGLLYEAQFFFGVFSIAPVPGYLDLVPLFSFIVGIAMVLGANVVKRRWTRICLAVVVAAIMVFFTIEMGSAITTARLENPFAASDVSLTSATCNPSPSLECTFILYNGGTDPVQATGAVLDNYGNTLFGNCDQIMIDDGTSASFHCSFPSGTAVPSQIQTGITVTSETQTITEGPYTSTTEPAAQYTGYVMIGNLVSSAQLPFTSS